MIRNDINIPLDQIDNYFLENRPGIDQPGYRVGKFKDEIVVYNPQTGKFMDYFYDDSSEEWFDLLLIDSRWRGYKLNRQEECLSRKGNIKLKPGLAPGNYPIYRFYKSIGLIHLMVAKLFIPNYSPNHTKFVDHIDNNRSDYRIEKLSWISGSDNNFKKNFPNKYKQEKLIYKGYKDKNYEQLVISVTKKEFLKTISSNIHRAQQAALHGKKYRNLYWKIENPEVTEYLNKYIGNTDIDESLWKLHYTGSFFVHPLGFIKFIKLNRITIGFLRGEYRHFQARYEKGKSKDFSLHIAVAEVFLNNNKPIEKPNVVSHKNTDSQDNRVENLEICTQSVNMKNPLTIKKLSISNKGMNCRKVKDPNGTIYDSVSMCGKIYGVRHSTISSWIRKYPEKGFKYIDDEGNESTN